MSPWWGRERARREARDEIRFHLDMRVGELRREGMGEEEARRAAYGAFGDPDRIESEVMEVDERVHARRSVRESVESTVQDLRFASRSLVRRPTLTAAAAISLGLGIGASATMAIAADALLWRPLPYDPNGALVFVGTRDGGRGGAASPTSVPDFVDLRESARGLDLAAYHPLGVNLGPDPVEWLQARRVSARFFSVVGAPPALGRDILPADERADAPEVVVLAHGLWQRRFGADSDVVGRTVSVDGVSATVVGVAAAGFHFSWDTPDVWLPMRTSRSASRDDRFLNVLGRVEGADLRAARRELTSVAATLAAAAPETNGDRTFVANSVRDEWYGGALFQQGWKAGLLATILVLLIACANVANLLLARGADRMDEIRLRRALGASRWRVLRRLLLESLLLAGIGGVLGALAATWGLRGLVAIAPTGLPGLETVGFGLRGVAWAAAIAAAATVIFGLAPALRCTGSDGDVRLVAGRADVSTAGRGRLRAALVVTEVALAVLLVATTGLVVRSVAGLRAADTGLSTSGALTFQLDFPETGHVDEERLREATASLEDAMASLPGVIAAGVSVGLPGRDWRSLTYSLMDGEPGQEGGVVVARIASPGWFDAVGLEPLAGRGLEPTDRAGTPDVILVNETFAVRHWPEGSALGRTIRSGGRRLEVVGVVPDVHELGPLLPAQGAVYAPLAQWPSRSVDVVLTVTGGPADLMPAVRRALREVTPGVAPHGVETFRDVILESAEGTIAMGRVLIVLSIIALVLAVIGVYASMGYSVARRIPEMGLRIALGADGFSVGAMVLRHAAVLTGLGLTLGLAGAALAAHGISAFMFGVGSLDPIAFTGAGLLLLAVCLAAAWRPARRAGAVDPVEALRSD